MNFKTPLRYIAMLTLVTVLFTACNSTQTLSTAEKQSFSVTASIYPLAFVAQTLVQDRGTVNLLIPAGGEPHDFEPTAGQIVGLLDSDLVLTVGTGIEPWLSDLRPELVKKQVPLLVMNESLDKDTPLLSSSFEESEDSEDSHSTEAMSDPHTWLDPILIMRFTQQVATALSALDPEGAQIYTARAEHLMAQLKKFDEDTRKILSDCKQNTILVSHNAFSYFARRYGLQTLSATGISPDMEPSAEQLASLTEKAKALDLNFIFMETLATPEIAEVLAKEAKLTTLKLNPLEGLTSKELEDGENYLSISEKNRDNLAIALQCSSSKPTP